MARRRRKGRSPHHYPRGEGGTGEEAEEDVGEQPADHHRYVLGEVWGDREVWGRGRGLMV